MQVSSKARTAVAEPLTVSSVRREADGVLALELRALDGSALPAWTPGAHIEVDLPGGFVRQYSLCGAADDSTRWRIAVLREAASRGGSKFIHDSVEPGDVLSVRGPRNNFGIVDADRYLFVAGGIGITPILPMARHVARSGKPWTLVYGGRTLASMAFVDELRNIPAGDVRVIPQDEYGLLDLDYFLGTPRTDTAVYCCGPGSLIDAVEVRCAAWPVGALHLERFAPKEVPRSSVDGEFDVQLARSGECLRVPGDRTLLEVLEDAGYDIDNSCRAGICGTCELAVADGIPEHNDDVLSDAERASNRVILPCVSRSKSAVLVIDL
ncbi:PDR/VanB family oxidoreductase [Mycolicibacterium brisbanense]|uniref:Phthalate 4,5-dioxygenase n=1 Tax=Mycolicibacterium brisbanense TaxID=146020 RepID=A0A100W1W7_9MYCO|nr:PDR/VanB family oxidoreductase [Mycolicibacterium brisbanense]MCV7159850.1 oxidoreductase [Mycolicibacterium brisbanense]GAS89976.1 phthalate 4,5-dioxygenase [Mycolicibacterium brisbanense]